MNSDMNLIESNSPHALVLSNDLGCQLVWARPSYEAALQTLRAWFTIKLVEYNESNDMIGDYPDPSIMSYEQIAEWVADEDWGWDLKLLPINTPVDPLCDFIENSLKYYPVAEQERIRRSVIKALD